MSDLEEEEGNRGMAYMEENIENIMRGNPFEGWMDVLHQLID